MSEDSSIIEVFEKFLEPSVIDKIKSSKEVKEGKVEVIEEILKLPISSYKFLDKKEAEILEYILDVFDIETASKLDKDNPFQNLLDLAPTDDPIITTKMKEELDNKIKALKEKFPNLEKDLSKAITISSLIVNIKNKAFKVGKEEQKIVVAGLDNAGKTALLSKFGGKLGIADLAKLKPTKGVDRQVVKTDEIDLIIWDMGGQEEYRKKYLKNPEKYFIELDLLIYVIDILDHERYFEAIKYLSTILAILETLEETPYVIVFFHKFDPDLREDNSLLLRIEMLKDVLKEGFKKTDHPFDYDIYLTSIYSLISNEPKFSKYLKETMKATNSLTDPTANKLEGLGKVLEETMNAVIKLSESITIQINNIDNRLRAIESRASLAAQGGAYAPVQVGAQPDINPIQSRAKILDELKDLFAKKKHLNY